MTIAIRNPLIRSTAKPGDRPAVSAPTKSRSVSATGRREIAARPSKPAYKVQLITLDTLFYSAAAHADATDDSGIKRSATLRGLGVSLLVIASATVAVAFIIKILVTQAADFLG